MGRRWLIACLTMVGALFLSGAAGAAEDVRALEKQLADELSTLSTSDCHLACRALASIRRAADRICALEPGPRCDAARAKAAEAARRVREACPECGNVERAEEESVTPASAPTPTVTTAAQAQAPRGGCRSCTTTSGPSHPDLAWWLLAAWTVLLRFRRAPKKYRRRP